MAIHLKILFLLLSLWSASASAKSSGLTENIEIVVVAEGDLKAEYALTGPLGSPLKAEVKAEANPCELTGLFRKVLYRKKTSIETWLTFECTREGQKSTYKIKRLFLDISPAEQKSVLPALSGELKNVQLKFRELSLKKGK